jgi:hypothetical protein
MKSLCLDYLQEEWRELREEKGGPKTKREVLKQMRLRKEKFLEDEKGRHALHIPESSD